MDARTTVIPRPEPSEVIAAGEPAPVEVSSFVHPRPVPAASPVLRAAYWLSGAIAVLMVVASAAGLFLDDLYREGDWAREALRGGDLVTLMLAAPILVVALALSIRGSHRAEPVWIGMLIYAVYDFGFYAFGATFNDAFLLHIAALSMAIFALACALPNLDRAAVAATFRRALGARWVGLTLALVGLAQGALWLFVVGRNALTGELLADVPVSGQHLVFALDLALLVPSLVLGGLLMFQRKPLGYLLGTALAVFGAVYQINMMLAASFQENAGVVGATAFPPESLFLTAVFVVASLLMLVPRRAR